jgi:hypothetical protein
VTFLPEERSEVCRNEQLMMDHRMPGESSHEIHFGSLQFIQFSPQTSTNLERRMSTKPLRNSTDVNLENSNTKDSPLQPINGECGKLSPIEVGNAPLLNC